MKISELNNIVTKVVKEMSGTSGGTTAGGNVTGGPEGEQTFTPVTVKKSKKVKQKVKDVEPKLAAGKVKNNYYVTHFGYTPAPSVPNRKSKAMDYKKLFEGDDLEAIKSNVITWSKSRRSANQDSLEVNWWKHFDDTIRNAKSKQDIKAAILDMYYMGDFDWSKLSLDEVLNEATVPDNIAKFAKKKGVTHVVNQVARWAEKAGKRIVGGTAIGKNYDTLILDLTHQGGEIYIDCNNDSVEVRGEPVEDYTSFLSAIEDNETINENYSQFRNKTSKREAPEQLHKAVKEIKKKLQEVDRLVEYTHRLRSEVSEGEGEPKYNRHTTRVLEQIQEMIKHTYIKAKKLK